MLETLQARIHEQMPVTRHLDFLFEQYLPGALRLRAPIAAHMNDKGTFFAGSQAALFTLGGWALTTLEAEAVATPVDVLAVENELKYTAPLSSDMVIQVEAPEAALALFRDRLVRRGRARLEVMATGASESGEQISIWKGQYLARLTGKS